MWGRSKPLASGLCHSHLRGSNPTSSAGTVPRAACPSAPCRHRCSRSRHYRWDRRAGGRHKRLLADCLGRNFRAGSTRVIVGIRTRFGDRLAHLRLPPSSSPLNDENSHGSASLSAGHTGAAFRRDHTLHQAAHGFAVGCGPGFCGREAHPGARLVLEVVHTTNAPGSSEAGSADVV